MFKRVAIASQTHDADKKTRLSPIFPDSARPISSFTTSVIRRKALCVCGGGCPGCSSIIQPKLVIGQPNDIYEQEADRVADEVVRLPEPDVQRKPT
jgi:hypothetical protein